MIRCAFSAISNKSDTKVADLVSASFGFVLRSPNGSETKPAGEPAPLLIRTINIKMEVQNYK